MLSFGTLSVFRDLFLKKSEEATAPRKGTWQPTVEEVAVTVTCVCLYAAPGVT